MTKLEKRAKEWAEFNSSPGIGGRDDFYEMLIEVQAQAYAAGFRKAINMCKDLEDQDRLCNFTLDGLDD